MPKHLYQSNLQQPTLFPLPIYQPFKGPVVAVDPLEPEQANADIALALSWHLAANSIGAKSAALIAGTSPHTANHVLRGTAPLKTAITVAEAVGLTIAFITPCGCDGRSEVML
jgi:hypothetical protein